MGKIQLVREHWNQNYNKVFAAPFQLFLSWVMKETLSSQQLQNLRATSFRVARSLIQFSNSECDLQKFLLLILLLQSECPAVPESLREKNNRRLASFNYSLGFVVFCQDQCCLTSHNTLNLLRQSKKYKPSSTQKNKITRKRTQNYEKSMLEQEGWLCQ